MTGIKIVKPFNPCAGVRISFRAVCGGLKMRFCVQFACVLLLLSLVRTVSATIYNGNGATGFGGPIGNGSLSISDDGAGNITITTNAAGGNLGGHNVAFYL